MLLKTCLMMLLFVSLSTFAGNPLQNQCDQEYFSNVFVQGINVISNWESSGPAVNIKVNGTWYAKRFIDSANDGFYQLAYFAYKSQARVNICAGSGIYRGIEFSQ